MFPNNLILNWIRYKQCYTKSDHSSNKDSDLIYELSTEWKPILSEHNKCIEISMYYFADSDNNIYETAILHVLTAVCEQVYVTCG